MSIDKQKQWQQHSLQKLQEQLETEKMQYLTLADLKRLVRVMLSHRKHELILAAYKNDAAEEAFAIFKIKITFNKNKRPNVRVVPLDECGNETGEPLLLYDYQKTVRQRRGKNDVTQQNLRQWIDSRFTEINWATVTFASFTGFEDEVETAQDNETVQLNATEPKKNKKKKHKKKRRAPRRKPTKKAKQAKREKKALEQLEKIHQLLDELEKTPFNIEVAKIHTGHETIEPFVNLMQKVAQIVKNTPKESLAQVRSRVQKSPQLMRYFVQFYSVTAGMPVGHIDKAVQDEYLRKVRSLLKGVFDDSQGKKQFIYPIWNDDRGILAYLQILHHNPLSVLESIVLKTLEVRQSITLLEIGAGRTVLDRGSFFNLISMVPGVRTYAVDPYYNDTWKSVSNAPQAFLTDADINKLKKLKQSGRLIGKTLQELTTSDIQSPADIIVAIWSLDKVRRNKKYIREIYDKLYEISNDGALLYLAPLPKLFMEVLEEYSDKFEVLYKGEHSIQKIEINVTETCYVLHLRKKPSR